MKIQLFSDQLRESLEKQITKLDTDRNDLVRIGQLVTIIRDTVRELKVFTGTYVFADQDEEIDFFKRIKPGFVSLFIFYRKLFALALFGSFRDQAARLENYQTILGKLERYTLKHGQLYEYWITGSTDLDTQYFVRGRISHRVIDADDQFTTGYDVKLAKLMANENLRKHILSLMSRGQQPQTKKFDLTWTAPKLGLIELLYALHLAKAVNKGGADIKVIAEALQYIFNVDLGNFYRKFQDFKFRKVDSTRFLDELKTTLQEHIDEGNK